MPTLAAPRSAAVSATAASPPLELTPVVDDGGTVRGMLLSRRPEELDRAEGAALRRLDACWRSIVGEPMELHVVGGPTTAPARRTDGPAVIRWRGRRGPSQLVRPAVEEGTGRPLANPARSARHLVLELDVGHAGGRRRPASWRAAGPAFGGPAPVDEWRWWLAGLACADPAGHVVPPPPRPRSPRWWHRLRRTAVSRASAAR